MRGNRRLALLLGLLAGAGATAALGTPAAAPATAPPGPASAANPLNLAPRASPEALGAGSWPIYGRDHVNSRSAGTTGPSREEAVRLGVVWSFASTEGSFTGTPVVDRGILVAGAGRGTVFALDAATGRLRWKRDLGDPINATAAIYRGRVYMPSSRSGAPRLAALALSDGRVLWRKRLDRQPRSDAYGSPALWRGRIYIGTSAMACNSVDCRVRGSVQALDWRSGRRLWKRYTVPRGRDGGSVWTTPAIDVRRERIYVGTGNAYHPPAAGTTDSVLALNARTGAVLAHFQATPGDARWAVPPGPDHDFGSSPNLMTGPDGRALVGEGQKSGFYWALDRDTLQPVWRTLIEPGTYFTGLIGSSAYDGRRIYGPSTHGGKMWALDRSGFLRWLSPDRDFLHYAPASTANGVVYTSDQLGYMTARDSATGIVLAKLPLGAPAWGGVSVAGGSVFASTGTVEATGYLVAFRPRKPISGAPIPPEIRLSRLK